MNYLIYVNIITFAFMTITLPKGESPETKNGKRAM